MPDAADSQSVRTTTPCLRCVFAFITMLMPLMHPGACAEECRRYVRHAAQLCDLTSETRAESEGEVEKILAVRQGEFDNKMYYQLQWVGHAGLAEWVMKPLNLC